MNRASLRRLAFSAAFCLTGVGTALLGAILPATLHEWQLTDSGGGLLLLAAWGGSTTGALLVRGEDGYTPVIGFALSSLSMFLLARSHVHALLLLYLLYGTGLGMAMTAISLMRSREVSAKSADLELNRLNLLWALGACFAPAVALHSLRLLSVARLFRAAGIVLVATACVLALTNVFAPARRAAAVEQREAGRQQLPWAPLRFCLFAAAAVGLESAIGSWLTTYTQRMTHGVGTAVSANAAFWAGLLVSRAAHSVRGAEWLHTRRARVVHVALVVVAALLMLLAPTGQLLPAAGLLSGLGLGPLYPYILAVSLPKYRSNAVFVTAGVGASIVPWATGAVSSASGSLRLGLLAPVATVGILLLVSWRMWAELQG